MKGSVWVWIVDGNSLSEFLLHLLDDCPNNKIALFSCRPIGMSYANEIELNVKVFSCGFLCNYLVWNISYSLEH